MKKNIVGVSFALIISFLLLISYVPSASATLPLQDTFQLKEYKQWTNYNPSYTFSKSSDSVLQMMSTTAGIGDGYAFMHINKDDLDGKKIRISWRWYYDWSGDTTALSQVYVVNNQHNRKLSGTGEFSTYGDAQHPVTDYTYVTACEYSTTSNGGWVNWITDTSSVLNLSGFSSSEVTIVIRSADYWAANVVGLQVDYLQILDYNNNVQKEYHFTDSVCMDVIGGYYDYGLVRKPTSMLYGTRDYAGMDAPTGEETLSGDVSSYVYTLFSNTGKYAYLANSWGSSTTPYTVYATTDSNERYFDYSAVFYKGHIWQFGNNAPCGVSGCTLYHNGIWNDDGTQGIADYGIDAEVREVLSATGRSAGTHDFVFIWACGHADTSRVGVFGASHSSGLLTSWMYIDPSALSSDGYHSPDGSDHVFISFDWLSIWYETPAANPTYNYGHWAYLFYYYALQGYTINDAMDQASRDTHYNQNYDNCQLDNGFSAWNPVDQRWDTSYMHEWGDGSTRLPR